MNGKTYWIAIIRRIISILLLIFLVMQTLIVLLLSADIDDFEIDEIHEVCGFIFLGLIVAHLLTHRKSLKSLLKFKN